MTPCPLSSALKMKQRYTKNFFFTAENVLVCKLVSAIETCIWLVDYFFFKQYRVIFGAQDINYI